MGLSDNEIRAAREKLRAQYAKLAGQYDAGMFNHARVDERYMQALVERLPMELFLANEVRIVRDIEKKAAEKYAPPPVARQSKADILLEEFAARISVYPPLEFSRYADDETSRLAGALLAFEERWGGVIPSVRSLPPGARVTRLAAAFGDRARTMLEPVRSGGLPRALDDLALALDRIHCTSRDRERLCKEYLKEAGFIANLAADLLRELVAAGLAPGDGPVGEALDEIEAVIHAFRLREFRLAGP